MLRLLVFILTTIIINCTSPNNPSTSSNNERLRTPSSDARLKTSSNNNRSTSSNIDTLKNSVLESACNESHKNSLKRTIAHQEKALTEKELKKSLENMKEDISCG